MRTKRTWRARLLAGLGLGLSTLAGCQAYYAGMTLPSPHYLKHSPTYIPDSPAYPYANELATQQAIAAQPEPGAPAGAPARVPAGPFGQ